MSQPVELSDELVFDAQIAAGITERSLAGQIEYWVQLGRTVEPFLQDAQVHALLRADRETPFTASPHENESQDRHP
jgi:hypothetical protein